MSGNKDELISTIKESLNLALQKEGEPSSTFQIESRIKELNNSMLELVQFITKTKSDDDKYNDQFKVISDEIKKLQEILNTRDKKATAETHTSTRIKELYSVLESESLTIIDFDNILVKQLIETIRVRAETKS